MMVIIMTVAMVILIMLMELHLKLFVIYFFITGQRVSFSKNVLLKTKPANIIHLIKKRMLVGRTQRLKINRKQNKKKTLEKH